MSNEELLSTCDSILISAGWKTIAYALSLEDMKLHIKPYEKELTELMVDFFKYYCSFDFASDVSITF